MCTDDADPQKTRRLHVSAVVEIPADSPTAPSSYERERHRIQDRQERAALRVQVLIFLATLAASFAAGVAGYYAYQTWLETKRDADAAWDSQRPWVTIRHFDIDIGPRGRIDDFVVRLRATATVSNVSGDHPALDVRFVIREGAVAPPTRGADGKLVGLPSWMVDITRESAKVGFLGPKELLPPEERDITHSRKLIPRPFDVLMSGVIAYRDIRTGPHRTVFCYFRSYPSSGPPELCPDWQASQYTD